jgi:hypothetical protein
MSAVITKIQAAAESGINLNWRELREEIHNEHERSETSEQREQLLAMFVALMDLVERTDIAAENLDQFRQTRQKDYNLLIVRECLVGENVCTETLDAVTQREVAAGRMDPQHELRVMAINGMAAPHHSRAELQRIASGGHTAPAEAQSSWRKLWSKFTRR